MSALNKYAQLDAKLIEIIKSGDGTFNAIAPRADVAALTAPHETATTEGWRVVDRRLDRLLHGFAKVAVGAKCVLDDVDEHRLDGFVDDLARAVAVGEGGNALGKQLLQGLVLGFHATSLISPRTTR